MRTDFDFRRTITTLTFCGSGIALTPILAWIVYMLHGYPGPLERIGLGIVILLLICLTGLAMTVALRQVNAHVAGADFSAFGGDEKPPARPSGSQRA